VGNDLPGVVKRVPKDIVDGEGHAGATHGDTLTTGVADVIDLDEFRRAPSQIPTEQELAEFDEFDVVLRSGDPVIQLPGIRRPQPAATIPAVLSTKGAY